MKLIGLLSWFDESPQWLSEAIESHHPAGLTHLVAVDGAYALYPGGRARSGIEQHRAISKTCDRLGISSTIHAPSSTWAGNEVEKRNFMFELGLMVATGPQDWFIVIDADHKMTAHDDLHARLSQTDLDAAEFTAWQRLDPTAPNARGFKLPPVHDNVTRLAYRANPGLRCDGNHFTYLDGQDRIVWGQFNSIPALDLTHVRIEHRTAQRDHARHQRQYAYYGLRGDTQVEFERPCDWPGCDEKPVESVYFGYEQIEGTDALEAGGINVCAKHLKRAEYENRARLAKLGRIPVTERASRHT